jgi:sterol desaturase/sphingolipid hydroxylase (fatty acid hydroxylase superfamily)
VGGTLVHQISGAIFATGFLLLLCTLVERVNARGTFRWAERWPGVLFGLLNPVFAILIAIPLKTMWAKIGIGPVLHLAPLGLGVAGTTLLLLLVTDFLMYWEHRFEHRFLWRVHAVHHSAEHLSAANNYAHPLQYLPLFLFVSVPLSLVDMGSFALPVAIATVKAILEFYIHSPTTLSFGRLRALVVDSPFHRIHHSIEERHFDRNFGILFSFWDQLFGTCHMPVAGEWPDTGVPESRSPQTVAEWLVFPFRYPALKGAKSDPALAKPDLPTLQQPAAAANRQAA